jgi:hypothetical protein
MMTDLASTSNVVDAQGCQLGHEGEHGCYEEGRACYDNP